MKLVVHRKRVPDLNGVKIEQHFLFVVASESNGSGLPTDVEFVITNVREDETWIELVKRVQAEARRRGIGRVVNVDDYLELHSATRRVHQTRYN